MPTCAWWKEMPRFVALYSSFKTQALHFLADPQWLIPNIIAPFILTLVALLLFKDSTGGNFVLYAVLGGGMMGMWGNTLYASGFSITWDRWWGTMEAILATPSSLIWIIAGRALWNSLIGILNGVFILIIAVAVFQAPLNIANPVMFFIAFFLTLLSLASLGLLFSSSFVLTRQAGVLTNGLEFPIYVGTGTMFPIATLPFWSHPLSLGLGPTWGVDAIRYAAGFNPSPISSLFMINLGVAASMILDLVVMIFLSIVYLGLSVALFRFVEMRARLSGELARF